MIITISIRGSIMNKEEVRQMDTLISKLNLLPNSYFEFVDSVVDYAKEKEEHLVLLLDYLDNNSAATPSDVIKFISLQPDFFDSDAPIDDYDVIAV